REFTFCEKYECWHASWRRVYGCHPEQRRGGQRIRRLLRELDCGRFDGDGRRFLHVDEQQLRPPFAPDRCWFGGYLARWAEHCDEQHRELGGRKWQRPDLSRRQSSWRRHRRDHRLHRHGGPTVRAAPYNRSLNKKESV